MNKYTFYNLLEYCNDYNMLINIKHTNKHYYKLVNNLQISNIFKNVTVPIRLSVQRWSMLFPFAKQCNLSNRKRIDYKTIDLANFIK